MDSIWKSYAAIRRSAIIAALDTRLTGAIFLCENPSTRTNGRYHVDLPKVLEFLDEIEDDICYIAGVVDSLDIRKAHRDCVASCLAHKADRVNHSDVDQDYHQKLLKLKSAIAWLREQHPIDRHFNGI